MTSSTAKALTMPENPGYGAKELKEWIAKYTIRGFLITLAVLVLLLLLYFIFGLTSDAGKQKKLAPIVSIGLENLPPPGATDEAAPPPPPSQQVINTGPAARAGKPVPVPAADIAEDLKEFATMEELGRASSEGGEGLDLGGFADNIDFDKDANVDVKQIEEEPAPDEFIPVEKEPQVDLKKLQKMVEYPDMARRAGIEGRVIVKVLVGKQGEVRKTLIQYTDSELLNEAALKAINEYGTFTPAIQNDRPVMCWVSIPIQFRLR